MHREQLVFVGDLVGSVLFHRVKADHAVYPGLEGGHTVKSFLSLGSVTWT